MHKGQGGGPGTIRPEQRDTRGDGIQNQKGDPKKLAEEKQPYPVSGVYHDQHDQREKAGPDGQATQKNEVPILPIWKATLQRVEKTAPKPPPPIQGNPPSSPAVTEPEARREAFERARAEHRRACRAKYG